MSQPKYNDASSMTDPAQGVPYPGAPQGEFGVQHPVGHWSTGLCSCTDDCGLCCLTLCCPCITFGRIADIVDRGSPSCGASGALYALISMLTGGVCQWLYSCSYRSKLRGMYNLPKSPWDDCLVHCCCEPCSLCQEYKELQNHGFDMALGWNLNMEKRGAVQPPVMQQGMMR